MEAVRVRQMYECPFLRVRCPKPSQHRDFDRNIPFGACSIWHRGRGMSEAQPHVICPVRFTQDQHIFQDASQLLKAKEGDEIVIIPELSLPMGRIDYILAQYDPTARNVLDFIVLEVMACSTTTTGHVLRSFHDILQGRKTAIRLNYGINFRQVISRMMVQVLAKAYACERWGKRMVWAVQDVLYRYMDATTKVDLRSVDIKALNNTDPQMSILFFVYGMDLNGDRGIFELRLKEVYGGDKEDFAKILEPLEIPETERLFDLIQQKVQNNDNIFKLGAPSVEGLAQVAGKMVRETVEEG